MSKAIRSSEVTTVTFRPRKELHRAATEVLAAQPAPAHGDRDAEPRKMGNFLEACLRALIANPEQLFAVIDACPAEAARRVRTPDARRIDPFALVAQTGPLLPHARPAADRGVPPARPAQLRA